MAVGGVCAGAAHSGQGDAHPILGDHTGSVSWGVFAQVGIIWNDQHFGHGWGDSQ
jgi:hypothetical protein